MNHGIEISGLSIALLLQVVGLILAAAHIFRLEERIRELERRWKEERDA